MHGTILQKTRAFYDRSNASGEYTEEQLEKAFDYMLLQKVPTGSGGMEVTNQVEMMIILVQHLETF